MSTPLADPLGPLLHHFNARAQMFFAGNLCSTAGFGDADDMAYLHLLRRGRLRVIDRHGSDELSEPSVLFYARPQAHRFEVDPVEGADLACATVSFAHQAFNPIALALPQKLVRPLRALPASAPLLELLFAEAFDERPGRQEVLNRLFEVVLIELLRSHLDQGGTDPGFLRGLGHPQIGKAMLAMHSRPQQAWTLDALAAEAALSRTGFAALFKEVVGATPGDYLTHWRINVAQALLRNGVALKLVAERVGYDSQAGFLRAFKAVVGEAPTAWKRSMQAEHH